MEKISEISFRNLNYKEWLRRRQEKLNISKTTKTLSGKIIDWIPRESQIPGPFPTPPPSETNRSRLEISPSPVIFDQIEPGPKNHVPVLRPDILSIAQKTTFEEFLLRERGFEIKDRISEDKTMPPDPYKYFHAASYQTVTAYGCEGWYNVWNPVINISDNSTGSDHSIVQTWVTNNAMTTLQTVETGLTVDHSLYGDYHTHLFTYFTTNGYDHDGDNVGGYDQKNKGWVQYHASIHPGAIISTVSQKHGIQYVLGIKVQLYQDNWWLGIDTGNSGSWTWLGFYPASLFTAGGLADSATDISYGGEVYSGLDNPCACESQMGSGIQAAGGFGIAAYQRNLSYQSKSNGSMTEFNGGAAVDAGANNCPLNPYTIISTMNSGSSWGSYQFYGGPSPYLFDIKSFSPWNGYAIPNGLWMVGDFNGDGRDDILHAVQDTNYAHVWLSNGNGTFNVRTFSPWNGYAIPNGLWMVGDFNGDGKDDILHAVQDTNYAHVWLSNGDGSFNVRTFSPWNGYAIPNGIWLVGDFNGDGRDDILHAVQDTNYSHVWLSNGDGSFNVKTFSPWNGYAIPNGLWMVGDFNGDGRDDIFHAVQGSNYAHIWLSNGDGSFNVKTFSPWEGYAIPNGLWMVGDFNGDGKDDIIHAVQGRDYANIWISNGDGTFKVEPFYPWPNYAIPNGLWRVGDFNGDGKSDIFHAVQDSNYANIWSAV